MAHSNERDARVTAALVYLLARMLSAIEAVRRVAVIPPTAQTMDIGSAMWTVALILRGPHPSMLCLQPNMILMLTVGQAVAKVSKLDS